MAFITRSREHALTRTCRPNATKTGQDYHRPNDRAFLSLVVLSRYDGHENLVVERVDLMVMISRLAWLNDLTGFLSPASVVCPVQEVALPGSKREGGPATKPDLVAAQELVRLWH